MNDTNHGDNFHDFREWRKAMVIFSTGFCPPSDPNSPTDSPAGEKWTSDEIMNMFDTGFRWAYELMRRDIRLLLSQNIDADTDVLYKRISAAIDARIALTFYDKAQPHNHTDINKAQARRKQFEKLQQEVRRFPKLI